jgi:hypothetical protein
MDTKELREQIAELTHLIWQRWMGYMLCNLDEEHIERWKRQSNTSYKDLMTSEKASDRAIADEYLALMPQPDKCSLVGKCEDETPGCSTHASENPNCWPQSEPQPEQPVCQICSGKGIYSPSGRASDGFEPCPACQPVKPAKHTLTAKISERYCDDLGVPYPEPVPQEQGIEIFPAMPCTVIEPDGVVDCVMLDGTSCDEW